MHHNGQTSENLESSGNDSGMGNGRTQQQQQQSQIFMTNVLIQLESIQSKLNLLQHTENTK